MHARPTNHALSQSLFDSEDVEDVKGVRGVVGLCTCSSIGTRFPAVTTHQIRVFGPPRGFGIARTHQRGEVSICTHHG